MNNLKWFHWLTIMFYATMLTAFTFSLVIEFRPYMSEMFSKVFSENFLNFFRVWGLLPVIIVCAKGLMTGEFGLIYPAISDSKDECKTG